MTKTQVVMWKAWSFILRLAARVRIDRDAVPDAAEAQAARTITFEQLTREIDEFDSEYPVRRVFPSTFRRFIQLKESSIGND